MNSEYQKIKSFLKSVKFAEYEPNRWGFVQDMNSPNVMCVCIEGGRRYYQLYLEHSSFMGLIKKKEMIILNKENVSREKRNVLDDILHDVMKNCKVI